MYSIQENAWKIKWFSIFFDTFFAISTQNFQTIHNYVAFESLAENFSKILQKVVTERQECDIMIGREKERGVLLMTYREICAMLREAGVENAEGEAGLLLAHYCGVSAAQLPFRKNEAFECAELECAVARRLQREPLQYVLGEWEFFGMPFSVSPDCLIPRADTELLVERAIEKLPRGAHFADFCTGSGCIAAAVLANRPDTHATLVDAFPKTLALAQKNCEKNGVSDRATYVLRDLLLPLEGVFDTKFDCILSNPPYIPTEVVKGLAPELAHEPQVALDGGADGLLFYRHFLEQSRHLLTQNGFWLFEIGYDQQDDIAVLAERFGFLCKVEKDLGGNPRLAYVYPRL